MAADVVNLRQARKGRARAVKEAQAQANRALFGRTKAERKKTEAERQAARQRLDAHRLSPDDETDAGQGGTEA